MNNDKATLYGWIALILGVVLIVVLVMWYTQSDDSVEVEEFSGDVTFYREEIAKKCTFTATTTAAQRAECEDILEEFSDILREYRDEFEDEMGTTTIPTGSTSTPTTTTP